MAEVVLRVQDKVNDDFYLNTKCTKRGDIIAVLPDGSDWGSDVRTLPFYRIIKLPNVSVVEASAMLATELDSDGNNPSRTLQRRKFRLDIETAGLPAAFLTFLADNTRAAPAFTISLSVAQFRARKLVKAVIIDPAVIG